MLLCCRFCERCHSPDPRAVQVLRIHIHLAALSLVGWKVLQGSSLASIASFGRSFCVFGDGTFTFSMYESLSCP
jgi:hypothetical protein